MILLILQYVLGMPQQIDEHFYQTSLWMLYYITYLEKWCFPPGAYVVFECCAHSPFLLPLGWSCSFFFFSLRIAWSPADCRTYQDKSSARLELLDSWITDQYASWESPGLQLALSKSFIGAAVTDLRDAKVKTPGDTGISGKPFLHGINWFICMLCSFCDLPCLPFD